MSVTITGVPESITRKDYLKLVRSIGIDPLDLVSLKFLQNGIYATVMLKDEKGDRYLTSENAVATHAIFIKVVDE